MPQRKSGGRRRVRKIVCAALAAAPLTLVAAPTRAGPETGGRVSTWLPSSGSWSVSTNWNNGVPNGPSDVARMLGISPDITVDGSFRLGELALIAPFIHDVRLIGSGSNGLILGDGPESRLIRGMQTLSMEVPLTLAGGTVTVFSSITNPEGSVSFSGPFSGPGPMRINTPAALLNNSPAWTGTLYVAADMTASGAQPLGSTSGVTVIEPGGALRVSVPTNEPFRVNGGLLSVATFGGTIEATSGTVAFLHGLSTSLHIPNGSVTLGGVTVNLPGSYSGTISGAITGTGHLRFAPIFNGRPYSIATAPSPDLEATIASTVNVMVPWRINGALRVEASSLAVNANMDVGRLEVLRSYDWSTPSITIAAGATLRATDPVMYLNSASVIRGDLAGVERTIVSHVLVPRYGNSVPGFGLRTVDLTVATGLRGTLEIHEGAMILPATFEPGVPNLIDLRNAESASIYVSGEGDAADTIRLNNATGGGLIEQLTFGSAAASLDYAAMNAALSTISNHSYVGVAPRIELGNIGARVGGRLRLLGAVSGGALTTTYASGVELRSPANSYTGPTHVSASSTLSILGQGQIRSSPDIVFGPYGSLFLGAAGQAEDVDRIGDTASVRFASGGSLTAHVAPQATERVGTIELQAGSVYVSVPTAGSTLRGAGLARARGAVLVARDLSGALAFDTPPANMNGIVGGWAVDSGNRFLRYDPALGLRPADATSTDLLTAGPADYVRVPGGASLTLGSSDVNVHALDTQGATLNLNGRRLTVGSGGLSAGVISNGSIVPGNDSGRELFVHGSGTLSATVADGPLGPTDLVVRGSGSISNTRILEGTHTFSGGLVVSNGGLNIGTTGFIPSARFIDVSTAVLSIGPNPLPPLEHVTLKGGSIFGPQGQGAANPIRAGRYEIHSGQFFAALAGYGRVVKTTQASATLGPGGSSFDGPIDVEEGILVLDAGTRGVVTVHKGAGLTLSGSNSLYDNTIVLNGGILQSHNANVLAPLRVTADSSWQHNVRVPGGLQSFSGGLYIDAGATLSYRVPPSQFAWEISGEIIVDGAFRSAVGHQVISSTGGTIPMIPGPNLRLGGKGLIEAIALVGRGARVAPALDDVGRLTVLELHQDATGKFELNLVDALAGPGVGWDVLGVTRTATLGGTNPAGVAEVVLRSPPGGVANFDPNRVHAWRFIESLSGVLAGPVTVNASGLQGITLPAGARFSVEPYPDGLYVVYVPEPSALALAAVAAWAGRRRRDRFGEN